MCETGSLCVENIGLKDITQSRRCGGGRAGGRGGEPISRREL